MDNKIHRRNFISVRVSKEEKVEIYERAEKANLDVSTYVRKISLGEIKNGNE